MTDELIEKSYEVRLVYQDYDGALKEETVHAQKSGDNFRLESVPLFAINLAYGDVISVENDDGQLYFLDLIQPSGHGTVQIVFFDPSQRPLVIQEMKALGCKFDDVNILNYLSVDIPDDVDYSQIKNILLRYGDKVLDFKEACLTDKQKQA